ncbi:outer membrane lipoprotein carrier protein LolA [Schleiferiaceae bacterium]|jgi:outer membrane lipoprotein-sorting protein|nr:outer membrane lipoprotein carrier protein LolA [Schleiferiaceae bacterium]MDB2472946.1 outer membrane lipoprotein carrier protein LolA [Schleiferiaceae bacterium]
MKIFALLLMPFMVMSQSHEEAKKLLNQVYESTLALESQHILFTNTIEVPSNGGIKKRSSKGELFAIGEKVRVKTDAFEFLSNGSKAYLIYPDDEEIEVAATDEEASLSPADILKNYQNGYSYKMAGRATEQGKVVQYIRLKPVSSEEIKEILIGVNMKTMLLDNYTQFGNNGSNNIFSVDNYEVNAPLDPELFNINAQEFSGFYRL